MKILYVENHDVFAANVIRLFLAQHDVIVVPSIARALEARAVETFDLMLVDFDLDDGKGDALVSKVRASGDPVTIVAVSSHDEGNAALVRAGASAICGKMEFNQIEQVIQRVCG
ncbi:response regulator [Verrucomicrobium sp. BvORR106]|uniref:response regulator n=1 Tax=Verrucomicrobium sp. BvORR106 TaxID=1403819 RepID=UPI0009DFA40C|nr:response regulator [Verrucomicrobium sp. BvORR106]